jgi:hypothetical protein
MRHPLKSMLLAGVAASAVTVLAASASGTTAVRSTSSAAGSASTARRSNVTFDVVAARLATARYATSLSRAKADGYRIITPMIPNMGYHFMNASVTGFDVHKPPILVYEHRGSAWQLGALEWVFTSMPSKPPLPGARYGVFGAACHYVDGTFVFADKQALCPPKSHKTDAAFSFWHPRLITLHFWIWYPNPAGIYMGTNPMVTPFNGG